VRTLLATLALIVATAAAQAATLGGGDNSAGLLATLALIVAAAAAQAATLGGGDNSAGSDLLPADEAFVLGVERQANDTLLLHWTIAPDYYLYRDRTEIALEGAGDARLGEPNFPPAKTKQDPNFGEVAVFYEEARARVPIEGEPASDAKLVVTYQGCNEPIGVCYPPIERTLDLASIEQAAVDGQTPTGTGSRAAMGKRPRARAVGRVRPASRARSPPPWGGGAWAGP